MSTAKRVDGHRYFYSRGGRFIFRRSVPKDATDAFGKTEVVTTLKAQTKSAALIELAEHVAEFERTLIRARTQQAHAELSADIGREVLERAVRSWFAERQGRFQEELLRARSNEDRKARLLELDAYEGTAREVVRGEQGNNLIARWISQAICEREGWEFEPGSFQSRQLMQIVARGQLEASRREREDLEGLPRSSGDITFSPEAYDHDNTIRRSNDRETRLTLLFEAYVAERRPAASTVKSFRQKIASFVAFLGHDNAENVTPADIVAWKNELLGRGNGKGSTLSAKTVNDTYLSIIRTVFNWGYENEKVGANPASRVKVRAPRKISTRSKALNDHEAKSILRASLRSPARKLSTERAFAQRWVPWLCAYTGARVNEITQLRAEDFTEIDGVKVLEITPEAGSVKNYEARVVPIHPHLIEQGLWDEVRRKTGPLFYDPSRHRGGSEGNPQSKKVGEHLARWVRGLGVDHPEVQPNHGWRHRFKSVARNVAMSPEIRDAIQGHAPRTEGEAYGDISPQAMFREISKLPRYDV
ncbi:DUF6538 domain-containing protein [Qipengyuania nanhaisediminis]|uniref:Phage integrase, N-terminal SAM-like domain n=1 Tax=Qipengyuania nanhaisediminis TaxID=604088 RepID=A0A1I5LE04_9SPHN|nr:DUF6538 domain-containing protein [Qipengyuania nanhaisediminis]SFO95498.1 Phage integrase, N-terminal SAM-like domain [Qipengyuania nanhaisediminis]